MTAPARGAARHGNAYEIFILVLTLVSLLLMALQLLPLDENTHFLVTFYDNVACFIFLGNFTYNMARDGPPRGRLGDVRRRRDHRCTRVDPGELSGVAAQ